MQQEIILCVFWEEGQEMLNVALSPSPFLLGAGKAENCVLSHLYVSVLLSSVRVVDVLTSTEDFVKIKYLLLYSDSVRS